MGTLPATSLRDASLGRIWSNSLFCCSRAARSSSTCAFSSSICCSTLRLAGSGARGAAAAANCCAGKEMPAQRKTISIGHIARYFFICLTLISPFLIKQILKNSSRQTSSGGGQCSSWALEEPSWARNLARGRVALGPLTGCLSGVSEREFKEPAGAPASTSKA